MIAGVALEKWKVPVFKRHLEAAGFSFTEGPGLTAATALLKVKYQELHKLQPIMKAAADECRASGPPANGNGEL